MFVVGSWDFETPTVTR